MRMLFGSIAALMTLPHHVDRRRGSVGALSAPSKPIPKVASRLRAVQLRSQTDSVQPPTAHRPHGGQAVFQAALEIDAAGLVEIAHRHRHVAEAEAKVDRLHEELSIED